jgi:hypothetical protein
MTDNFTSRSSLQTRLPKPESFDYELHRREERNPGTATTRMATAWKLASRGGASAMKLGGSDSGACGIDAPYRLNRLE